MSRRRVCGRSLHSRKGAIKDRLPFIPCSPGHQLGAAGNEAQHSSTTSPWRWQTLTRGRNYGIWNRRDIIRPSPPYKVCQVFPPSLFLSIPVFNGFVDHDKCSGIRNFTSGKKRKWTRDSVVTRHYLQSACGITASYLMNDERLIIVNITFASKRIYIYMYLNVQAMTLLLYSEDSFKLSYEQRGEYFKIEGNLQVLHTDKSWLNAKWEFLCMLFIKNEKCCVILILIML